MKHEIKITYSVFASASELPVTDRELLQAATAALENAYAPYSQLRVAAAIQLESGEVVTGMNQENASFPAGICAEGTALSVASALHPGISVKKIAITARSANNKIDQPITPCGICRQKLMEYQKRFANNIEVILGGETGDCVVISSINDLLPLSFEGSILLSTK